jgi:glycosyltransferase involved in cell wall biosynthesis
MPKIALFHRQYLWYAGGHGKVWDYFNHVKNSGLYEPRIFFTSDSIFDKTNPWLQSQRHIVPDWKPEQYDLLFLAGMDWDAIPAGLPNRIRIINLIQHVRHADPGLPLYRFLKNRAFRICVSQPVADAILATGQVNGPVAVIPNGIEIPDQVKKNEHSQYIFIDAVKNSLLGEELSKQLAECSYQVDLVTAKVPRLEYLTRLAKARLAILLPHPTEGFYLPGLEAMAVGTPVIMADCVGNREYARHNKNCLLIPNHETVKTVLSLTPDRLDNLHKEGLKTAQGFTLDNEYRKFIGILNNIEVFIQ